ncbi:MAG: DUF4340 domain-containing protein [Acetobacteraceae bacterium]|nr:DUF4340 domain-containing protein [Acetobacteraceae bacterium]
MRPRTLIVLVVLGIVALGGGWYLGVATAPTPAPVSTAGTLMFPGLAPRLQSATKVEIVHQDKPLAIERNSNGAWGLADRGGYPVQETKLRAMLTALTELRVIEPRTSDPTQYAQLGVEDPHGKDSNSNLLQVLDSSGKPIVSVIVGHRRVRTQGNVPEQVYVRRPDETQSWLAEGSLSADADAQLWIERDIMNIDHGRIATVTSVRGDTTLEFVRDGDKLVLRTPADHPKLDDYRVEDVSRALELLTLQDVHKTDEKALEQAGHSVFATNDGLSVTATAFRAPKESAKPGAEPDFFVRFEVAGADKAKPEADRLAAKVAGWTYQLGGWKEKSLVPSVNDLKATEPPAPAAAAPAKP